MYNLDAGPLKRKYADWLTIALNAHRLFLFSIFRSNVTKKRNWNVKIICRKCCCEADGGEWVARAEPSLANGSKHESGARSVGACDWLKSSCAASFFLSFLCKSFSRFFRKCNAAESETLRMENNCNARQTAKNCTRQHKKKANLQQQIAKQSTSKSSGIRSETSKKIPVVEIVSNNVVWLVFFYVSFTLCNLFMRCSYLLLWYKTMLYLCASLSKENSFFSASSSPLVSFAGCSNYAIGHVCARVFVLSMLLFLFGRCIGICGQRERI